MTYRTLRNRLNAIPENDERLSDPVSIVLLDTEEVFDVIDIVDHKWGEYKGREREAFGIHIADGVLDDNHIFLTIDV